jgi:hypothetical protein
LQIGNRIDFPVLVEATGTCVLALIGRRAPESAMAGMVYFPQTKLQVAPTKHAKAESSRSFTMAGLGYLAMAFLILVLGVVAASL